MANSTIYLIFTVSSLTLHLRFCCNNTGKRNLRKKVLFFFYPMTWPVYMQRKCLPVLLTCLNAFMLSRKEMSTIFTYESPHRMIWFHLWNAWWLCHLFHEVWLLKCDFTSQKLFKWKCYCRMCLIFDKKALSLHLVSLEVAVWGCFRLTLFIKLHAMQICCQTLAMFSNARWKKKKRWNTFIFCRGVNLPSRAVKIHYWNTAAFTSCSQCWRMLRLRS